MKQFIKTPLAAAVVSLGLTFSAQADMQDRLAMIEALEVTQDYDHLNELVANDYGLNEFHRVLSRAAAHHEDIGLITTLLNLPALDKDSPEFKRVVSGVFSYLGQFEEQNVNILETLLPYFADDQMSLDNSLFFIFEGASGIRNYEMPGSDAARLLVRELSLIHI